MSEGFAAAGCVIAACCFVPAIRMPNFSARQNQGSVDYILWYSLIRARIDVLFNIAPDLRVYSVTPSNTCLQCSNRERF